MKASAIAQVPNHVLVRAGRARSRPPDAREQSEVFGLSDGRTFEIINCDVREAPTAGGSEWVIGGP